MGNDVPPMNELSNYANDAIGALDKMYKECKPNRILLKNMKSSVNPLRNQDVVREVDDAQSVNKFIAFAKYMNDIGDDKDERMNCFDVDSGIKSKQLKQCLHNIDKQSLDETMM